MSTTAEHNEANRAYYNPIYSHQEASAMVQQLRVPQAFLDLHANTVASWVGLYRDDFSEELRGRRVLELGCGLGHNAILMASLGAEVVAIDIAEAGIEIARVVARQLDIEDRVDFIAGDFLEVDLPPGSFDIVVGKGFLHHLTEDQEDECVRRLSRLLTATGKARFVEALPERAIDRLREMIPVAGRPSSLQRAAFAAYRARDPHPERDNSPAHYTRLGQRYFHKVDVTTYGGLARLNKLLPNRDGLRRRYRELAFRMERALPGVFVGGLACLQTISWTEPKRYDAGRRVRSS